MRFMRRAKSTRFVLLYVLGVEGNIYRPGPATPCAVTPFPMIELMPLRPRIVIFVLGLADEFKFFGFSGNEFCLCGTSCSLELVFTSGSTHIEL